MKHTRLLTFLFLPFFLFSQEENMIKVIDFVSGNYPLQEKVKIFFDKDWRPVTDENSAHYYRIINFKKNNVPDGIIIDYHMSGEIQSSQ